MAWRNVTSKTIFNCLKKPDVSRQQQSTAEVDNSTPEKQDYPSNDDDEELEEEFCKWVDID